MLEATLVIDPGHGGTTEAGGSSANNAISFSGVLEKSMTLQFGQLVRRANPYFDNKIAAFDVALLGELGKHHRAEGLEYGAARTGRQCQHAETPDFARILRERRRYCSERDRY